MRFTLVLIALMFVDVPEEKALTFFVFVLFTLLWASIFDFAEYHKK